MAGKHTSLPWKATKNAYGCSFVQRWEAGEPHELICGGNNHDTLTDANAEFIVRACNSHDELLEALEIAAHTLSSIPAPNSHPLWTRMCNSIRTAEQAIAKAKGEDGEASNG